MIPTVPEALLKKLGQTSANCISFSETGLMSPFACVTSITKYLAFDKDTKSTH